MSEPTAKYKSAIIGTGRIAGRLEEDPLREHPCTHAGIYSSSPEIELLACAGRKKIEAFEFASKWKIPRHYTDYRKMLQKEKPDIVSICTPAPLHAEMAMDAVESGVKAIFCEKPLATNLKEADKVIKACLKNKVSLTVNHLRRWGWDYRIIKTMLLSGEIGKPETVHCLFSGNILHTGTHMFDILRYLFGEVESIQGEIHSSFLSTKGSSGYFLDKKAGIYEDPEVSGLIFFENGTKAWISGKNKNYFIFEMDIVGSSGRIRIGNHLLELWKPSPSNHYTSFIDLQKIDFPLPSSRPNPWLVAMDDLLSSLKTGKPTSSTGLDARKSMEIAFALILSSQKNKSEVKLPLKRCSFQIKAK